MMTFSTSVTTAILLKTRRHCARCRQWCGGSMVVAPIQAGDDRSEANAIALCSDCHQTLYARPSGGSTAAADLSAELGELKTTLAEMFTEAEAAVPGGPSDFGRGFRHGAAWAQTGILITNAWDLLSLYGDAVLEIVISFGPGLRAPMRDGRAGSITGGDHGAGALAAGMLVGFWTLDSHGGQLALTPKGQQFRSWIERLPGVCQRYTELNQFWTCYYREPQEPSAPATTRADTLPPSPQESLLGSCLTARLRLSPTDPDDYVLDRVDARGIQLLNLTSGECTRIAYSRIKSLRPDSTDGSWIIGLKAVTEV